MIHFQMARNIHFHQCKDDNMISNHTTLPLVQKIELQSSMISTNGGVFCANRGTSKPVVPSKELRWFIREMVFRPNPPFQKSCIRVVFKTLLKKLNWRKGLAPVRRWWQLATSIGDLCAHILIVDVRGSSACCSADDPHIFLPLTPKPVNV